MRVWKKITAFCLAFAMVTADAAQLMPVAAPPAMQNNRAIDQAATLKFIKEKWEEDQDTQRATVIEGSSIGVDVKINSGYTSNQNALFDYINTQENPKDKVIIDGGGGSGKKTLKILKGYPAQNPSTTVMITGNYTTTIGRASALETIDGTPQVERDAEFTPPNIIEDGSIKLTFTAGETYAGGVGLGTGAKINPSEAKGALKDFTGPVGFSRIEGGKKIQIELHKQNSNEKLTFTMTPTKGYKYFHNGNKYTDENGLELKPGDLDPQTQKPLTTTINDVIQKGEEITLIVRPPKSNTLTLTVYSANAAVEDVRNKISTDGTQRPPKNFMKLSGNDQLKWITDDFQLRQEWKQWNSSFDITWEWNPDDPANKDAVVISKSNGEWLSSTIKRAKDDIEGKLTAKVKYTLEDKTVVESQALEIPILIRGTGTPPLVTLATLWEHDGEKDQQKKPLEKQYIMDVFQGNVPNFDNPKGPYRYAFNMDMGLRQSSVSHVVVEAVGDPETISIKMEAENGDVTAYKPGEEYKNPAKQTENPTNVKMVIDAVKEGTVTLKLNFYILDAAGQSVKLETYNPSFKLTVWDTSPSEDATLKELTMKDGRGELIDYGFTPDKISYDNIEVPYTTEEVFFKPVKNDHNPSKTIKYRASSRRDDGTQEWLAGDANNYEDIQSGKLTSKIKLKPNYPVEFEFVGTAQNPNITMTYTIKVMRLPPDPNADLAKLGLYAEDDKDKKNNYITTFDPLTQEYRIDVPYKTTKLRVEAIAQSKGAKIKFEPELSKDGAIFQEPEWLMLDDLWQNKPPQPGDKMNPFKVKVYSEQIIADRGGFENVQDGDEKAYTITINKLDPNEESGLAELKVYDKDDKELKFTPGFQQDKGVYRLPLPYLTGKIKLSAKPVTDSVSAIVAFYGRKGKENQPDAWKSLKLRQDGSISTAFDIAFMEKPDYAGDDVWVLVASELATGMSDKDLRKLAEDLEKNPTDENLMKKGTLYILQTEREEPSDEARLNSLIIKDQDGQDTKKISFNKDTFEYNITVPYETEKVSFTAVPEQAGAKMYVKNESATGVLAFLKSREFQLESGVESRLFDLNYTTGAQATTKFVLRVTAESFDAIGSSGAAYNPTAKNEYVVNITREPPSSEARLINLETSGTSPLSPKFAPNTTDYKATVTEGADKVTITATAAHPGATITIAGNAAQSGVASDPLQLLELTQKIEIVVTAQDGVTKKTYTIEFFNENLIEKNDNADLASLKVNYGTMTPKFKPSITEYEVAVTEDTWAIDIVPRTSDWMATFEVFAGTKSIGDDKGNYSQALQDGENELSVVVTSSDKTKTKTYQILVYRNDEEKLKDLLPLDAEQVDFENSGDIITIFINEYPRVKANVFEALKEYPDKTIIFQGNDYSLEFKGADLKDRIIPQKEIYDFRMWFQPPEEDEQAIWDIVEDNKGNNDLKEKDIVMMYFPHHGSLPAPAILNMSLGHKYANQIMYWHYYNQERDRIDYYGRIKTNAKGTFAVKVDHFSTYMAVNSHQLAGSESKNGNSSVEIFDDILNNEDNIIKVNPHTGTPEEKE